MQGDCHEMAFGKKRKKQKGEESKMRKKKVGGFLHLAVVVTCLELSQALHLEATQREEENVYGGEVGGSERDGTDSAYMVEGVRKEKEEAGPSIKASVQGEACVESRA